MKYAIGLTFTGLALMAMLACSSGSSPDPKPPVVYATSLSYTDPTGTGYRLVKDVALSTTNTLVLELRGPEQGACRGVSFGLTAETAKAAFVKVNQTDTELAQNAIFELGNTEPKLFKGVMDGSTLRVSIAQKGTVASAKPLNGALARVALHLQPNVARNVNITLTANDARILPASGGSEAITIAVGTLKAQ
jgi:hypothetical protein